MNAAVGQPLDKQLFWVAYAYPVQGVVERRRSPVEAFVRDTFPVEISVVSSAQAPTAMLLIDEGRTARRRRSSQGRLWRPVSHPTDPGGAVSGDEIGALLAGEDPQASVWRDNPFCNPMSPDRLTAPLCRTVEDMRFREIKVSGRDQALRDLARLCSQTMIVDGELYQEAPEPAFVVTRETDGRSVAIDLCDGPRPRRDGAAAVFRGDRHREARAFAQRLCTALRQESYCDAGSIRFIAPAAYAFKMDELSATVRQCCLALLEHGFGSSAGVEWLSVDEFAAWHRFRDAAATFLRGQDLSTRAAAAPLEALTDLVERLPKDRNHPADGFARTVRHRASLPLLMRSEAAPVDILDEDLAAIDAAVPQVA